MVRIPPGVIFTQDFDENRVSREGIGLSLQLLGKYLDIERDSPLLLSKEFSGDFKYLRLRNQESKIYKIWMGSGFEEMWVKSPKLVFKEDSDAAGKGTRLTSLRLTQRHRSGRNRRRVSKTEWLPNKAPMTKRRKSFDTKSSPSDASPYEGGQNSESEDKPNATCQEYTLVNADDKESILLFYHYCLMSIKAVPMKKILKAWIKVISDKKQVTNPYKYRESTKPGWWPPTTGDPNSNCRHIEPDHLHNKERLILAVWLLHSFDVKRLRHSTQQIAVSVEEKYRANAVHFLHSMYNIRELEEDHEDGERNSHSQISLNIPMDKLQELVRIQPPKMPTYHYPKYKWKTREMVSVPAQAPSISLPCNIEAMMNEGFARDSEEMPASRRYIHGDLSYQQNTAGCSVIYADIGIQGSTLPYVNEIPSLYDVKSPRDGPPLCSDPSNSAFCESLNQPVITSTIKAEQANTTAFSYDEHNIASFSNAATTSINPSLPTHVSRSELQCDNAYRDTYGEVGLTAWSSDHIPTRNRNVPDNLLLCTPNIYNPTPGSSMEFYDVVTNYPDHSGKLVGEGPQWQSQLRNDAAYGANWSLSEFDRLLCIAEGG